MGERCDALPRRGRKINPCRIATAAHTQDLFNIQPRRPNWDLKRDMNARMGKLERRTNEAIATILRQRLREQRGKGGEQVDLVAGIREAQAEGDRAVASDDDEE